MARQNVCAVESWLRCRQTYVWVYEAQSVAHFMQGTPLSKWPLGDAGGSCAGAAVWFAEGHVARVARGWHGMHGVEGAREHAPWLRYAAGGGGVAGPRSCATAQEVGARADGERRGAALRASRVPAVMDATACRCPEGQIAFTRNAGDAVTTALQWARGSPAPVSGTLQRYVSALSNGPGRRLGHLQGVEFGGGGDCLFFSIAGILARMVVQGGEPAQHVLQKIPASVFAEGKNAVMLELRRQAAQVFHTWYELDVLNFVLTACMQASHGAHVDEWDPFQVLRDCGLQLVASRGNVPDTVRAWQEELGGDAVAIVGRTDARRGGGASQDIHVRIPGGTEGLRKLRCTLAHVMSRPGHAHWGTETDVASLSDRLQLGILLFRDRLPTGARSCVYSIGSVQNDFLHWIALWWEEPTHFRGAELAGQAFWTDATLPQALRDQYSACNQNAGRLGGRGGRRVEGRSGEKGSLEGGPSALRTAKRGIAGGHSMECVSGIDVVVPSTVTSREKSPDRLVMQGVASRRGSGPAVHMLPRDLLAPVRIIRESDFRALRVLRGPCERPEAWDVPGLEFVPGELRAHLWRTWGETEPLLRVMQEMWVRGWPGWGEAWDALAGAPDTEDRFRVVEEWTVKFMEFLMGEVVFEAKTDKERAADLTREGRCVGAALAHGVSASLADSIFQLLSNAGWCGDALASEEGRRVACESCLDYLRNVEDAWLNLVSHGGELNVAAHAGEIVRFALTHHGMQGVALPDRLILRTYSRFDGQVGPRGNSDMTFSRAELQGKSLVLGQWLCGEPISEENGVTVLEVYNETGVGIRSTCYRPVWARAAEDSRRRVQRQRENDATGARWPGRVDAELAGTSTMAKRARVTGKRSPVITDDAGVGAAASGTQDDDCMQPSDLASPPPPAPHPVPRRGSARNAGRGSAPEEARHSQGVPCPKPALARSASIDATGGDLGQSGTVQSKGRIVEDGDEGRACAAHVYRVRAIDNGHVSADGSRGGREEGLRAIAGLMTDRPTVPEVSVHGTTLKDAAIFSRGAVVLPHAHCAFRDCGWQGSSDAELRAHVVSEHHGVLRDVAATLPCHGEDEAKRCETQNWSAYNEAIAWKVREGAPLAALAIDRRCLREYARSLRDDAVHSLVCMVCARKFPRVEGRRGNPIEWRAVSPNGDGFFGLPGAFVREHMTVDAYVERFGQVDAAREGSSGVHLRDRMEEFDDWHVSVPSQEGPVRVLCCPEDMRCTSGAWHSENTACSCCEAPLCGECGNAMAGARGEAALPPAALANDLMAFYSPEELFSSKVTVLEMICASVCITSMVCFTLEKRYRKERAFDMEAGGNDVRMAARGNATSFPMPWTDLLAQLTAADATAAEGHAPPLPRTGAELAGIVSVILKSGGDDDTAASMATFVHQALVRRKVVVGLIEGAKARGHRAYRNVDMDDVRKRAMGLPEEGVPAEIMRLVPLDDALDKIQMQKAATPVPRPDGVQEAAEVLESTKTNAVVCEKSSFDEGDINAQRIEAVRTFVQRLDEDCVHGGAHDTSNSSGEEGGDGKTERACKRACVREGAAPGAEEASRETLERGMLAQVTSEGKRVDRLRVRTGNVMMDQFEPWYFGVAFAFLFKYCTGMPDCPEFMKRPRHRRGNGAPRVELPLWVRIMSRRIESQLCRDWHFGFVSWNLVFRSAVNLSRTWFTYVSASATGEVEQLTPEEIGEGAKQIYRALDGKYVDVNNRKQNVKGDMTKVRHVPGLGKAAHKLLTHIEHTSRRLPGTQEARRVMRFETNALRVRYGVPIFVTFSPDEGHNLLMVRLSRTRRQDPVHKAAGDEAHSRLAGDRDWPRVALDVDGARLDLPLEAAQAGVPSWAERRRILARDPMASVDGFRILVDATLRHLFGLRTCPNCPRCNHAEDGVPCQDLFGSNAKPVGGAFGRVDAYFVSIEAQKSTGSLHAHCQVFIQCLHQHTPLEEVFEVVRDDVQGRGKKIVEDYLEYKGRVCRQVYSQQMAAEDINRRLEDAEKSWPEFKAESGLFCRPAFQTRTLHPQATETEAEVDAVAWEKAYLDEDVQYLQERKQNHVHLKNEETGERVPLPACRRKDNPKLCKADFPRTAQIIDRAIVVCPGRADALDMPKAGRRNRTGSLHGPMNHASLNGTHPCMLSAQRFNSDVQLPYRFPITEVCCTCGKACDKKLNDAAIIKVAQMAQDAQAGYACDYCTKRQPMAFHEVKECCKGVEKLGRQLQGEHVNRIGKRVANRIMSDAYGKGIVRGQVECANLRAFARENDVTAAESLKSCETTAFYGREYVNLVERLADRATGGRKAQFAEVDMRQQRRRKVIVRDVGMLYGLRPQSSGLWDLSPYEFATYWTPVLLSYPTRVGDAEHPRHHATLTQRGTDKLREHGRNKSQEEDLVPGVDYRVKEDGGDDWVAYPDTEGCAHLRHTWVLKRNKRPMAPTFFGAPVPRGRPGEAERSARIVMTYFHPWTLRPDAADQHVVFAGSLCGEAPTWETAMVAWLDGGVQTKEAARYVGNFLSVYRVRPRDADEAGERSDEDVSDEELDVGFDQLDEALKSRVGGKRRKDGDGDSSSEEGDADAGQGAGGTSHYENSKGGMAVAQQAWGLQDGETPLSEVAGSWPAEEACDLDRVLKEARRSRNKERSMNDRMTDADGGIVVAGAAATSDDVAKWLEDLEFRVDKHTKRRVVNAKQFEMVKKVARRVMQEIDGEGREQAAMGEPLQWCMHGGPGTGKSHVLRIIRQELFEGLMKWTIGVNFQIAALQAVMAQLLGGDTIHHACGIPAFKRGGEQGENVKLQYETAKRVLQWRWLFIDEISMVSARLLAEVDAKLRGVIRDVGTTKRGDAGVPRPFGGLNVVLSGDFWQLAPPDGGFLADVPTERISAARKYTSLPPVLHGQSLLWGGADCGVQGVTELEECERCDDAWLKEVQEEFRIGALTADAHAFLHGRDTTVTGSWLHGGVGCGNRACRELCEGARNAALVSAGQRRRRQVTPKEIRQQECQVCREERARRRLVLDGPEDSRLQSEKFLVAPGVFPNNDVKYEANKLRASQYARRHGKPMVYVPARDTPSSEALRERPDLPQQKMAWLQRHDKESGDLYGFLPIAADMPVALTDHIDRSEDKNLLRGRVGRVQSWICDGDGEQDQVTRGGETILKKTPKVIFVLFDEGDDGKGGRKPCKWTIEGLKTPGLYPVVPQKKDWFVDKGRPYPRLKIKRRQFPLAPAFGVTAHAAQGQTFKQGVIVDLSIGGGTSPLSSYVALTRVQRREDMLIFRTFDIAPYQNKDARKGPGLLLRTLRGEDLDWEAIEKEFMPSGRCAVCGCTKYKNMYPTVGQWSRADGLRVCSVCLEDKKRSGTPWQCMECGLWKCLEAFHASQHHPSKLTTRRCVDCPERRSCRVCDVRMYEEAFAQYQWELAGNSRCRGGMCAECEELKKHLTCGRCKEAKLATHFAKRDFVDEARLCDKCKRTENKEQKRRAGEVERKKCSRCCLEKPRDLYSDSMWEERPRPRECMECVERAAAERDEKKRNGKRKEAKSCMACGQEKAEAAFSEWMWAKVADKDRKCDDCVKRERTKEAKSCITCGDEKSEAAFSEWMWTKVADKDRKCEECAKGARTKKVKCCMACGE